MKKIDLHIHTVSTMSDRGFTYSLDVFKRYVSEARLDAVAVTNHDWFDAAQFKLIQQALTAATVFPGIEVNVEKGHLLVIAEAADATDFEAKAKLVSQRIAKIGDTMSVEELQGIFGDLSRYLVIPHYDKSPPIAGTALEKLKPYICAGEVDSAKKFVRAIKDTSKLAPVLFSDARIGVDLTSLPTRQTYIDCGDVSLGALKTCLRDKAKVSLTEKDGNELWHVFPNGQKLSTGLNVVLGGRSSGKTHTLDAIAETVKNVKYLKQFSLVQENDEREFANDVERQRGVFVADYLSALKRVVDEVAKIDLVANARKTERYLETLLKSAEETDRRDSFSQATLFSEVDFAVGNTDTLRDLINSVRQVIENIEFRPIIEKHVELAALQALARELIELLHARTLENETKKLVNGVVNEVKHGLAVRTSATAVDDVDLYGSCMDAKRVQRFTDIVGFLMVEKVVHEETIQGFRIEAKRERYAGAGELKLASNLRTAFAEAFRKYNNPYEYLRALLANKDLAPADLYKFFVKISYRVLNRDGFAVSGGERSEFRLLHEIKDAKNFEVLLIDEPESSFDNLFLRSDVNQMLKAIAETMPVVVVTHNSTVGASVGADYLLHTRKIVENGKVVYRLYSGYPTDKELFTVDGASAASHTIVMDSLEAGAVAYESRRQGYEAIKR